MIGVISYRLGAWLASVLPPSVKHGAAEAIGELNWLLRWHTRAVVAGNLNVIHQGRLSGRELDRSARRVILNFARAIALFLELPSLSWDDVRARADLSELEAAIDAVDGNSFVAVSGHIGPWELGGLCLARLGHEVHTVALDHPSPAVTRFYTEQREKIGLQAHRLNGSFARLKAAIDAGHCVALLIDRAYGKAHKRFTLFGVESEFPLGHLVLSVRCNVPVITGALVFDGPDRFRYVHGGTHRPDPSLGEKENLEALQERCLRDLEDIIRRYPEQWFQFRPLKRTESYGD